MSSPKVEKLEKKIKDLNALKADYRKEIDYAAAEVKAKRMEPAKYEKLKARHEGWIKKADIKIHVLWEKAEAEKKKA